MLAAFMASVARDLEGIKFTWIVPLKELLPAVIDDLVRMCVTEHRDNNMGPEGSANESQCIVRATTRFCCTWLAVATASDLHLLRG